MNKQRMVDDFMREAGQYTGQMFPTVPDFKVRELRARLMLEETLEFIRAQGLIISHWSHHVDVDNFTFTDAVTREPDLPGVGKELSDVLYVAYGAAVSWGIKIDPVFGAVHEANMNKFGPGSYAREDGKWIKPPDWQPPDIESVLKAQGWESGSSQEMSAL